MYIALEGIDGVGKTTQINRLKESYPDAVFTKEPGATTLGAKLRELILGENDFDKKSELFLFLADRAEHTQKVLAPNIKKNKMIFSDRSLISGIAYANSEFDMNYICELNRYAVSGILPDKAVIFIISKDGYSQRIKNRGIKEDNIEKKGVDFMMQTQERFLQAVKMLKIKYIEIDAMDTEENISKKIKDFIND